MVFAREVDAGLTSLISKTKRRIESVGGLLKVQKKLHHGFVKSPKIVAFAVCFVILLSLEVAPAHASLSPARDLSGTWQSAAQGMYYEMDPSGTGIRMSDVTATFAMDITQDGSQITIALYLNPISYVTDSAYNQEYGIPASPPIGGEIDFTGTVSSSSFTASETGSQLTSEQLTGTFTTNIITATLSGTAETSDQNGLVVTLTSSGSSGTSPTSEPTSSSTTGQQLASRYYGNIESVKGQAGTPNGSGNTPLSTGQMASGTEIQTGSNGIVAFETPNQGGTVYLGANSDAGWVGLTSEPAPDNGIQYMIYPQVSSGSIFPNGNEQLMDLAYSIPLDVALGVLVFSHPFGEAVAVGLFVEGGAFLIPSGVAYVKETVSHLIAVPQGAFAGENTEYTVDVSSDGTTTVQVLEGPVIFMDPVTNNTVTVNTNEVLTLPPAQQSGFSSQDLQSDVSTLDSASVNHWWTQSQSSTSALSLGGFVNMSLIITVVAVVVVVVLAGVGATVLRKRRAIRQIHASESSATTVNQQPNMQKQPAFNVPAAPSTEAVSQQPKTKMRFCPNCGQQLPQSKNFCPYCGSDLNAK